MNDFTKTLDFLINMLTLLEDNNRCSGRTKNLCRNLKKDDILVVNKTYAANFFGDAYNIKNKIIAASNFDDLQYKSLGLDKNKFKYDNAFIYDAVKYELEKIKKLA